MTEPFFGVTKRCYLQEMINKYGDIKVAKAQKGIDGEIYWSKHRSVLECWHSDEGLRFLDTVNNRTGFECEIRLDTDPENGETPEQSLDKFNNICNKLESIGIRNYGGFFSGSRGYHAHIFTPGLMRYNETERKKIKEKIIESFKAEGLKASSNSMMTLEWAENNKTGKIKTLLRGRCEWIE